MIPDQWLTKLLEVCQLNDFSKVEDFTDEFLLEGYATSQIIEQLSERIIFSDDFTDKQKAYIGDKLGVSHNSLLFICFFFFFFT